MRALRGARDRHDLPGADDARSIPCSRQAARSPRPSPSISGLSRRQAWARAVELLGEVGIPDPAPARVRVPASALGRHAAARDDRHGDRLRSRPSARGRADDGARRDDPGGDPRAPARPACPPRDGDDPHHARPRRGRRAGRRGRHHVRRSHRRACAGRGGVRPAPPPVHPGAAARDADARARAARASRPSRGRCPASRRCRAGALSAIAVRSTWRPARPPCPRSRNTPPAIWWRASAHEPAGRGPRRAEALRRRARPVRPPARGGARRRRRVAHRRRGRDARAGGRVGLRQVDARPAHPAAHRADGGRRAASRGGRSSACAGAELRGRAARDADHLPGSLRLAESAHAGGDASSARASPSTASGRASERTRARRARCSSWWACRRRPPSATRTSSAAASASASASRARSRSSRASSSPTRRCRRSTCRSRRRS